MPAFSGALLSRQVANVITTFVAPETSGGGSDAFINAFHQHKGEIRKRVAPIKLIVSVLTLGSGGSGGREGPTMQIGAAVGSLVGRLLRLTARERRLLLVAGNRKGYTAWPLSFASPLGAALLAVLAKYSIATTSEARCADPCHFGQRFHVVLDLRDCVSGHGALVRPCSELSVPAEAIAALHSHGRAALVGGAAVHPNAAACTRSVCQNPRAAVGQARDRRVVPRRRCRCVDLAGQPELDAATPRRRDSGRRLRRRTRGDHGCTMVARWLVERGASGGACHRQDAGHFVHDRLGRQRRRLCAFVGDRWALGRCVWTRRADLVGSDARSRRVRARGDGDVLRWAGARPSQFCGDGV